jgi:hypothetical protein
MNEIYLNYVDNKASAEQAVDHLNATTSEMGEFVFRHEADDNAPDRHRIYLWTKRKRVGYVWQERFKWFIRGIRA